MAAAGSEGGAVRWSTADDQALEEAVVQARMGLLFVGGRGSYFSRGGLSHEGIGKRWISRAYVPDLVP